MITLTWNHHRFSSSNFNVPRNQKFPKFIFLFLYSALYPSPFFTYKFFFMKKNFFKQIAGFSLLGILFFSFASFIAQKDEIKTITGEILDMKCYMSSGAHGDGHKDCAASCVKRGAPMGILTDEDKVYLLIEDGKKSEAYEEAKKHAGEKVAITGTVTEKGGVQAIIVSEVKAKM